MPLPSETRAGEPSSSHGDVIGAALRSSAPELAGAMGPSPSTRVKIAPRPDSHREGRRTATTRRRATASLASTRSRPGTAIASLASTRSRPGTAIASLASTRSRPGTAIASLASTRSRPGNASWRRASATRRRSTRIARRSANPSATRCTRRKRSARRCASASWSSRCATPSDAASNTR